MTTKHSVLMVQPNYLYGDNAFAPYSVGSLQAYAQEFPEIREGCHFQLPLFLRTDPSKVIREIDKPAIACFSCYLWNWQYNKMLAQAIRTAFPECLIIFGGENVPDASEEFFVEHPYVDILVHHEGEISFARILQAYLSSSTPDYSGIPGLSLRVEGTRTFKTAHFERIQIVRDLPSPYLNGVFDQLFKLPFVWNASQETNRGCPYSCTFCTWGGVNLSKIYPLDEGRILAEFEWFGLHRIEYLFCCDANFGILNRDIPLTEEMIKIRAKHNGFPRKFRMCTAKNSNQKIFAITAALNKAGMSKGATLSFQSMDEGTLIAVDRKNIGIEAFHSLMQEYRKADIPTYTELIMGMPGESYESTKRGIDTLLHGQADCVNLYVYVCTVLPNSEMRAPHYVQKHGIKWARMPILLAHSTPEPTTHAEYQDVIIETATMPPGEWERIHLFYFAVQAFHCLGLLQQIAILFHQERGILYSDFYERLIEYFAERRETAVGEQITRVRELIADALNGGRFDMVLPQFGEIYWPLEEASLLLLISNKEQFYSEIRSFVDSLATVGDEPLDAALLDDLVRYQALLVKDPFVTEVDVELQYDLHHYFTNGEEAPASPLKTPTRLHVQADKCFEGDWETFAREVVWYGRKGGRLHYSAVTNEPVCV